MNMVLWLLIALQVKHFIFDFYWQPPVMWQNKGTFGHWGGISHSYFHACATFIIVSCFLPINSQLVYFIPLCEFVVHYMTDWAKMNINRIKGWGPTTHNQFWQLTGFDQLIHQLTYVAIIAAVFQNN